MQVNHGWHNSRLLSAWIHNAMCTHTRKKNRHRNVPAVCTVQECATKPQRCCLMCDTNYSIIIANQYATQDTLPYISDITNSFLQQQYFSLAKQNTLSCRPCPCTCLYKNVSDTVFVVYELWRKGIFIIPTMIGGLLICPMTNDYQINNARHHSTGIMTTIKPHLFFKKICKAEVPSIFPHIIIFFVLFTQKTIPINYLKMLSLFRICLLKKYLFLSLNNNVAPLFHAATSKPPSI